MKTKRLLIIAAAAQAAIAFPALTAHAQDGGGFGSFFRSITNAVGGGRSQPAANGTSTIGIRGADEVDKNAAAPVADPKELKKLDSWASTKPAAESAAKKRGLVANKSATLPSATTNTGGQNNYGN